ncbi:MAG: restriction endonuclease, partial [Acidobacteriota bacterium]
MSSKRHHAEWLSLVEVSGPFLTTPVLEKVFPQGLDAHDADAYRNLRLAFEEWEERPENPALHRAWVKYVLQQTLGLPDEVLAEGQAIPETIKATAAEHGETLRPDFVVRNPANGEAGEAADLPRLLVQVYPAEQHLERAVAGLHWKASPATRMMELLHASDVKLGLVTNGEHWMLVYAPRGETTGFASWYAGLWLEEKLTLQAFRSLLGVQRFFGVADGETLEAMLAESAKHQQEVTEQLGYQVRRAVEVLIQSLDRADQDHGRALLARVPEAETYESALTVMMRLVFLFCAEERDLLLLNDPLYDQNYAVSTLVAQLQETADQHGEEVLERRLDAWVRLLSTFRAVFGGVEHERMKLPAYGGRLFDPDRFPFLEGRAAGTKWRET